MVLSVPTCGLVAIFFFGAFIMHGMSKSGEPSDVLVAYWPVLLAGIAAAGAVAAAPLNRKALTLSLVACGPGLLFFLVFGGWDLLAELRWVRAW
jgi:hypothetical protein